MHSTSCCCWCLSGSWLTYKYINLHTHWCGSVLRARINVIWSTEQVLSHHLLVLKPSRHFHIKHRIECVHNPAWSITENTCTPLNTYHRTTSIQTMTQLFCCSATCNGGNSNSELCFTKSVHHIQYYIYLNLEFVLCGYYYLYANIKYKA